MVEVLGPVTGIHNIPIEVDVYRDPHLRMRELMNSVLEKIQLELVNLNQEERESILQSVYSIMWEMKTHEIIENNFIMNRLREKLSKLKIYNNLVCNCHEDSTLLQIIQLVEDLYYSSDAKSRAYYWQRLQEAMYEFTEEFLPHMEEEESNFQPLLLQYFEYDELKQLKETVLVQHMLWKEKVEQEKNLKTFQDPWETAIVSDSRVSSTYCREMAALRVQAAKKEEEEVFEAVLMTGENESEFRAIPEEVLLELFSYLGPQQLLAASAVCRRWRVNAANMRFWRRLPLVRWESGGTSRWWSQEEEQEEGDGGEPTSLVIQGRNGGLILCDMEDLPSTGSDLFYSQFLNFLPRIGPAVKKISVAGSQAVSDETILAMLQICPNIEVLNLSYTSISDRGLKNLGQLSRLRRLDLSGCINISDSSLSNLASDVLEWVSLSGCVHLTDTGIRGLRQAAGNTLKYMDFSGCYRVTGEALVQLTATCVQMSPENIAYCNLIQDGPYPESASGCQNLDSSVRSCCLNR